MVASLFQYLLRATRKRTNAWCRGLGRGRRLQRVMHFLQPPEAGKAPRRDLLLEGWGQGWQDLIQHENMKPLVQNAGRSPFHFFQSFFWPVRVFFFFIIGYLMSWCSFCLQDDYGVSLDPHRPPEPHSILRMHIACAQQWPLPSLIQDPPGVKGDSGRWAGTEK